MINITDGAAAQEVWDALNEQNRAFGRLMLALSELYSANQVEYAIVVKYLSTLQYLQVRLTLRVAFR